MDAPSPLIDVLSPESFASEHLPDAINCCVYETAFIDRIRERFPDPETGLTVYGLSDDTREADVALSRLKEAGYHRISKIAGGLEGWKNRGGKVEKGSVTKEATGYFEVDADESFIHWTGRNLFNYHCGGLRLKGGHLVIGDDGLAEGDFIIDMTSLSCTDLTDSAMNRMLVGHLQSSDFFETGRYPEALFSIRSATAIAGATRGVPNYRIAGELTLRGKTAGLEFDAVIAEKEGEGYVGQALIEIDRTRWGAIYGSGKFFARLGQHVVNDLVSLHLKIIAKAVDR